jgi:hypothetical protein
MSRIVSETLSLSLWNHRFPVSRIASPYILLPFFKLIGFGSDADFLGHGFPSSWRERATGWWGCARRATGGSCVAHYKPAALRGRYRARTFCNCQARNGRREFVHTRPPKAPSKCSKWQCLIVFAMGHP